MTAYMKNTLQKNIGKKNSHQLQNLSERIQTRKSLLSFKNICENLFDDVLKTVVGAMVQIHYIVKRT